MDPVQLGAATNPMLQPTSSIMFVPHDATYTNNAEGYLASLDSDTRDYVLKHTDDYRSTQDIQDCIYRLHHSHKTE